MEKNQNAGNLVLWRKFLMLSGCKDSVMSKTGICRKIIFMLFSVIKVLPNPTLPERELWDCKHLAILHIFVFNSNFYDS
jgi:hypothetical protein